MKEYYFNQAEKEVTKEMLLRYDNGKPDYNFIVYSWNSFNQIGRNKLRTWFPEIIKQISKEDK